MQPVCYLHDPEAQAALNAAGDNCWHAYVEEILRQLGLGAAAVSARDTGAVAEALVGARVVFVGDGRACDVRHLADPLARWVEAGGTLIGFAPEGLDDLFGNTYHSVTPQRDGGFAMMALLRFRPHPLTSGVYAGLFDDAPAPVYGPLRKVQAAASEPLADFLSLRRAETVFPAITRRRVGAGAACYFAFDLAQTMWVLHKGRPVDGDYDLDGYLRLSDAIVTGALPQDVPYADQLLFVLQNLVHAAGVPMIHQLPPIAGEAADLLVFFGGDDEGLTDGSQVAASDFMASRGLPYHINIMPDAEGRFGLTAAEFARIVANGHEPSLHYNFIDGFAHPCGFTAEDVARQWGWYVAAFGHEPIATVNHWCRWTGWAEPAKWMRAVGGRACNSRLGLSSPPLNPVNHIGLAFGTAFPHYYYDDWRGGNARVDFLAEPILAYEVGYTAEAVDPAMTARALDIAARFHMTACFFHHPIYVASLATCREAIDGLVRAVGERGLRTAFMGCDGLWRWWDARTRSGIEVLALAPAETRLLAHCEYGDGMVVKAPARGQVAGMTVGGTPAAPVVQEHLGLPYVLVPVPQGETEVTIAFA